MASKQLCVGKHPSKKYEKGNRSVFQTDSKGKWWCGWHFTGMSTRQLLLMVRSIERDILRQFPNMK